MLERYQQNGEQTERIRSYEFPKNPEDRLNALLASFNGSPKAIAFLLITEKGAINQQDLAEKFNQTVSGTPLENWQFITTWRYMTITLLPAGIVSERTNAKEDKPLIKNANFEMTDAGNHYGISAATLILDFEKRNGVSIRKILGKTASPSEDKIRAPYVRSQILTLLSQKEHMRRQDIIEELGFTPSVITTALESLGKNGLIEYSSVSRTEKGIVKYELVLNADAPTSKKARPSIDEISAICQKLSLSGTFSATQVEGLLSKNFLNRWTSEHALKNFIQKTLSEFTKQGYLRRTEFKGGEKYSNADITSSGLIFVNELLEPLMTIVEDRSEEKATNQIASKVLGNLKDYARNSAELYYPYSTSKRLSEGATDFANIFTIIKNGSGISIRQLSETLGLDRSTILNHVRIMQKTYGIKSELIGVTKFYSIDIKFEIDSKALPPTIRKTLSLLNEQRITLEDKIALLIYTTWAYYGSVKKAAELLKTDENKVRKVLSLIESDEELIGIYDIISEDETEE